MKMMRVDQVMNQPPISCRGYETLNHAAHLMWEHDCGAIPVVNDRDEVVGIITDRDICMAAYSTGDRLTDIPVARIMARRVYSVRPDHSVEDAEQLMADKQVRRLPVVDAEGQLLGMLSLNDLARHVDSGQPHDGVIRTMAAICKPRSVELARTIN